MVLFALLETQKTGHHGSRFKGRVRRAPLWPVLSSLSCDAPVTGAARASSQQHIPGLSEPCDGLERRGVPLSRANALHLAPATCQLPLWVGVQV
jgi:hypothetical protein